MSTHPAIRVSGLSKLYKVGARQQGYKTLRETIADACWAPLRKLSGFRVQGSVGQASSPEPRTLNPEPSARLSGESFWALQDVSFEVQPGEVVGIIGRNGAGKSTLLKILSRITEPTSGRIELRGRVGSLLEVGTGFHPELTGRENIYMNGSILGMSRREIAHKFDEIVDFSGVEDFLDTPVKRYSSGMYVRLAFAVAAHLEPEILIVDEVLAVGDAEFQRKCLGKMQDVASHGRTVLFVSHQLGSLASICSGGVLLSGGAVEHQGTIESTISSYLTLGNRQTSQSLASRDDRNGNGKSRIMKLDVVAADRELSDSVIAGEDVEFRITLSCRLPRIICQLTIYSDVGVAITSLNSTRHNLVAESNDTDSVIICKLSPLLLLPGRYRVNAALFLGAECIDHIESACEFVVVDGSLGHELITSSKYSCYHQPCKWLLRSPSAY